MNINPTLTDELEQIIELELDSENARFINPYSLLRHKEVILRSDEYHFTIRENGIFAGFVILALTEGEYKSVEFRRVVVKKKGAGLGRKVLQWVKSFSFEVLKCHRLWLDVYSDNSRAIHLYLTEGFIQEGIKRECILKGGKLKSLIIMSILESEYDK